AKIEQIEEPVREKMAKAVIEKLPKEIQAIMAKPASERTPYEQQLHDLAYRQVTDEEDKLDGKFKGEEKEKLDELKRELASHEQLKPKSVPSAMLVTDIGKVAPAVVIPKDKSVSPIEPGFLTLFGKAPARIEPVATT